MKTILITGTNRGLGLEFVKQLCAQEVQIIATCRTPSEAHKLNQLINDHNNLLIKKLDVTDDNSIQSLVSELHDTPIDWLINNAGINGDHRIIPGNIERDNFMNVFNVNCLGTLKISDSLLPNLYLGEDKLIVCISSLMSSITENQQGRSYAYRASKAALNCAMRSFALDVLVNDIKVMLLSPGWVKTRIGGPDANLDAQTSVTGMLHVIHEFKSNSHGEVLRNYDGMEINW